MHQNSINDLKYLSAFHMIATVVLLYGRRAGGTWFTISQKPY